jgi:transcription elongation factor Elf1
MPVSSFSAPRRCPACDTLNIAVVKTALKDAVIRCLSCGRHFAFEFAPPTSAVRAPTPRPEPS